MVANASDRSNRGLRRRYAAIVSRSRHASRGAQPSGVAVALCVVIVAGAVLFGIFGPGIAQRSQLGGRRSLGELVAAAAALADGFMANAVRSRIPSLRGGDDEDEAPSRDAVATAIRAAIGATTPVPDLTPFDYGLAAAGPVVLRTAQPDAFAIFYLSSDRRRGVTLVLAPDDGEAFLFDDFGRPTALEPGSLVEEPLDRHPRDESVALLWSDGTLLHIVIAPSHDDASRLRDALGAP